MGVQSQPFGSPMKFSRRTSLRVNDLLDRLAPPAVRDSGLFRRLARAMYGPLTVDIVELKTRAFYLTRDEYSYFYQQLQSRFDQGVTDLTPESLEAVLQSIRGSSVLDVACGLGYVCERL